jgi:hypothetical protein
MNPSAPSVAPAVRAIAGPHGASKMVTT